MKWRSLLLSVCSATLLHAQQNSIFSLGGNFQYGFIFAHSTKIQNTAGATPRGIQLEAVWQKINQETWDNCYCYPHMGFSLTWFDYNNSILGHGISGTYFLEPSLPVYKGFGLTFRGQLGLTYLTNPYDPVENPTNMSYSLPITGYVGVGVGSYLRLNKRLRLNLFANYLHASNGGIRDPNKGIDWPVAGAGLSYAFNPTDIPKREKVQNRNFRDKKIRIDAFVLGTLRIAEIGEKRQYPIYGVGLTASKQVGILNAITAGIEWHGDEAIRELQRRRNRSDRKPYFAGMLLGNEFLLGHFIFSQQLGYYLYNDNIPDFPMFYHRWGLSFSLTKSMAIGVNLKAYSHHVHFFDFRFIYSL